MKSNKKPIVLVDIDGVLSDDRWREKFKDISWEEYHSASKDDQPHYDMLTLINGLYKQGYQIIAITTRPEKWRMMTMQWLIKFNVQICDILMRPDNDFRRSPELKVELAKPYIDNVAMVIDNREDVIEAFNSELVTTILVKAR